MPPPERTTAEGRRRPAAGVARLHEAIIAAGPKLKPRIFYGIPGYATGRNTPVLAFFRLDDGVMTFG